MRLEDETLAGKEGGLSTTTSSLEGRRMREVPLLSHGPCRHFLALAQPAASSSPPANQIVDFVAINAGRAKLSTNQPT